MNSCKVPPMSPPNERSRSGQGPTLIALVAALLGFLSTAGCAVTPRTTEEIAAASRPPEVRCTAKGAGAAQPRTAAEVRAEAAAANRRGELDPICSYY